jgi:hypothetical protein
VSEPTEPGLVDQQNEPQVTTELEAEVAELDERVTQAEAELEQKLQDALSVDGIASRFWKIVEVLAADDTQEITDAAGNCYTVRTTIAMRQQLIVFRCIREIMETRAEGAGDLMELGKEGDIAGALTAVLTMIDDEKVIDLVEKAFTVAFPKAVQDAIANAGENGEPLGAVDLFPVEEIVGALLPFAARLVKRMVPRAAQSEAPTE